MPKPSCAPAWLYVPIPRRIVVGGSCNQAGPKPVKKAFVLFGGLFLLRHSRFVSDPAYERQKGKSGSASHVL
jgi:hypothetical protein